MLDRVSQYLLKEVIYTKKEYKNEDMLFRIIIFKIFNKESTWEELKKNLGDVTLSNFSFDRYNEVLTNIKESGKALYNDAYISCANKAFGYDKKHENHLALIEKMFKKDKIQDKIEDIKSMQELFDMLKSYPLIGDFMAYQLATDINYSNITNFSEDSFTIAGPGAKRGINKYFKGLGKNSYEDVIKYMYSVQENEFKRLGLSFKYLGNRKLQLIDIQNLFCELDKYLREARPEIKSNRVKIKKKYTPNINKIEYTFPPKWKLEIK